MAKIEIPFVGEAYTMPARQLDSQTCINWYVTIDRTGKFPLTLSPDPGLEVWATVSGAGEVRGLLELNGIAYAAIDNKFYSFDTNGNPTELGTLNSSKGNVRMVANDKQIFITDTKNGYVYQLITDENHTAGDFFQITEASSLIGPVTFTGGGLDDMTTAGAFTGTSEKDYVVQIIETGGAIDEFRWSDDGGNTWSANVTISGTNQNLSDGVQIIFQHTTGHTRLDKWTFSATPDSAFYVPIIPAYQDGYGVYVKQKSNIWYISAINDFSRVNALDFASSNLYPDNLVAGISLREELWLIGRTTTEIWYDVGAQDFPFEPRTNLLIKYGTLAPYSIAVAHNNLMFWLGNNEEGGRVVLMVANYTPEVISTEPINAELQSYEKTDDAIGFAYQWDGHIFYALIFPTADKTWVYDITTKMWHQKTSTYLNEVLSPNEYKQGRWRANNYMYFNDLNLMGDWQSGKIYKFNRDYFTEDGSWMLFERTTQVLDNAFHRRSIYSLEIDMQKGTGLTDNTAQGHDPQIMLQISKDDGMTWGNELWKSFGKKGAYNQRIKWNRLGMSESYTFRVRVTDPVYTVLMGAVAEMEDLE